MVFPFLNNKSYKIENNMLHYKLFSGLFFIWDWKLFFAGSMGGESIRSSRLEMFFKICILENFGNFTGKHMCWRFFFTGHLRWLLLDLLQQTKNTTDHIWLEKGMSRIRFYGNEFWLSDAYTDINVTFHRIF